MGDIVPDYPAWFGLKDSPFRLSPDLDFFYPAESCQRTLEIIRYGINRGEGFLVLKGRAGSGKTMLLRLLFKDLPSYLQVAFIVTPTVSPRGLMVLLLEELGIPLSKDRTELGLMLKDFQNKLLDIAREGKRLLIVIDEAQDLPLETLEQLRLLSNIETTKKKLVQILLVGQPELQNLLADPRLCQLAQRISINETLLPLSPGETENYVRFRITRAGGSSIGFSEGFFKRLHSVTNGLPRLINRVMDRTLLMAAASRSKVIDESCLKRALSTLPEPGSFSLPDPVPQTKNSTLKVWVVASLIGMLLTLILIFIALKVGLIPQATIKNLTALSSYAHQGLNISLVMEWLTLPSHIFRVIPL